MKVDILQVTENDEIVVWVKVTGKIYKKKVAGVIADIYRKELESLRVIKTVICEPERQQFFDQAIQIDQSKGTRR